MHENTEGLRLRPKPGMSLLDVYRKMVADGWIKLNLGFLSIEPKNDDLTRIHDIIQEIDLRRAFYERLEHERADWVIMSIREARQAIHVQRRGIWGDLWARAIVQKILDDLADFLTRIGKYYLTEDALMKAFSEFTFGHLPESFEQEVIEMRLRIWSAVAELVVAYGDAVKPKHLPEDLLDAVRSEYEESGGRKGRIKH